jgi:hypothetical protein
MSEYRQIADNQLAQLRSLQDQKAHLEETIRRVSELAKAAINAMPDEEKGPYLAELAKHTRQQMGLTQAIRELLQATNSHLAATQIKEILEDRGYDFSAYTSNPLSSIHSILKRFKPSEVSKELWPDGVAGYRWKKKPKAAKKPIPFFGKY